MGGLQNPIRYNGALKPPVYELNKINGVRLGMWSGSVDLFITEPDVQSLLQEVPSENWVSSKVIDNYAHFDFVWGKDAKTRLYPDVIRLLSAGEVPETFQFTQFDGFISQGG